MERLHEDRLQRLLDLMRRERIARLWVEPSVDFFYLTGIETISLERLTGLLVAGSGELRLVVPDLLVDDFAGLADRAELTTWSDAEGPRRAVGHVLRDVDLLHVQGSLPMWSYKALREARGAVDIHVDPGFIGSLRQVKSTEEINALRDSARAADEVMRWVAEQEVGGVGERILAGRIKARYLEAGHDPGGATLVASGPHSAAPHHIGDDTPIDTTQPLLTDFGGRVAGYWSDTTRVHFPAERATDLEEAWDVVCAAYDAAFAAARVGTPCREVDRAAREVIDEAGYGDRFIHRTGHGIGLDLHEPPYITATNELLLEVGHAFTIEPGIYLTGKWGLRHENVVVLTEDGPEALNASPRMHELR
ncbi:MAG: Xaa-Pro peptidase family protein [Actinomycetota bacterium]|nr:Xaa-Pro peptidase family protein [Actinomycetota bacterium]